MYRFHCKLVLEDAGIDIILNQSGLGYVDIKGIKFLILKLVRNLKAMIILPKVSSKHLIFFNPEKLFTSNFDRFFDRFSFAFPTLGLVFKM